MDIGRYPDAAAKYHISDASTSRQLPTLILFKNGKEVERRPYADHKGKLIKFLFSIVCIISIILCPLNSINILIYHTFCIIFNILFICSQIKRLNLFQDNVKAAFDLNNIYNDCKKNLAKRKEKKPLKAE